MSESPDNSNRQPGEDQGTPRAKKPGIRAIIQSTLAAAFGVQSNKNREQDFQHGNIWVYIAAGVVFTAIFIFAVLVVVRLALSS